MSHPSALRAFAAVRWIWQSDVRALIPSPVGDISVQWRVDDGVLRGTVAAPPQVDVELSGSGLERR